MSENVDKIKERRMPPPEPSGNGFFNEIDVDFLVHELKGPVAVIEAGIRRLLEKPEKCGPLSPLQERTLKRTLRNSRKARRMLNELLEVGRAESGCFITGGFRPVDAVFTALIGAVEIFSADLSDRITQEQTRLQTEEILRGESIFFAASPSAATVEIVQDQRKLEHIAGNLIKNALHHRKKRVDISVTLSERGLEITVKDDGPGVPPAFHNQIFERYTQADACAGIARQGHGLGLAGARALARCLGGDILLESRRSRGAAFRFYMPV